MQMFPLIILLALGIVCLYLGAELLVVFAARLAISFGMAPLAVGLTVVAFSTSTPELASTITAQLQGDTNLSLGTVVGSNIANIGLVLGLLALIKPMKIQKEIKRFEVPFSFFVTLLLWALMLRGQITRWMGVFLTLGIIAYVYYHLKKVKANQDSMPQNARLPFGKKMFYIVLITCGVALLALGGNLLIKSAVGLASLFNISDRVIGLTVVALGTSLPEFAASLVAIFRKLEDVAIGNILGSNIFNILFILGVAALIRPISFAPKFFHQDVPILLAYCVGLWILVSKKKVVGRLFGLILVLSYAATLYWIA